jgi:hypothetical protein
MESIMKAPKKAKSNVVSTGTLKGAGSEPEVSAQIGGVANKVKPNNLPSSKK